MPQMSREVHTADAGIDGQWEDSPDADTDQQWEGATVDANTGD